MYDLIRATDIENSANVAQIIGRYRQRYPEVENDEILRNFVEADSPEKTNGSKIQDSGKQNRPFCLIPDDGCP